ncbi:MAG: 16S rRNA (guanine(527)-N(7))-methyltransferase RsmG [Luteitalea sp.]|nr:16S rRNA (guanine(527)-N(7))-methyltransferase RsmG [Luteitalea sp.]
MAPERALRARLAAYLSLLSRWNRRMNLVAFDDPDKAVDRLIVEPLMAAQWIPGEAGLLIDVGSGGGSPAIPLKLALPDLALVMVESRVRKAAFLQEAVRELGLSGTEVARSRFEALVEAGTLAARMDVVTVRAIRVGTQELAALGTFLRPGGRLLWFRAGQGKPPLASGLEVAGEYPLLSGQAGQLSILRKVP